MEANATWTDIYVTTASFLDSPGSTEEVIYTIYWKSQINTDPIYQMLYLNCPKNN